MLTLHSGVAAPADGDARSSKAFWIDLLSPTAEEISRVSADYGIAVPSRESLQEIEA